MVHGAQRRAVAEVAAHQPQRVGPAAQQLRRLQADKKTRDGVVHFVLPTEIGKVQVVNDVPEQVVLEAVDELRRISN